MFKHATIGAWNRDHHDGSYSAEIEGWTLAVRWHPEGTAKRRGFSWTANGPGASLSGGRDEPIEEIENAMVAAEEAAKHARRAPPP